MLSFGLRSLIPLKPPVYGLFEPYFCIFLFICVLYFGASRNIFVFVFVFFVYFTKFYEIYSFIAVYILFLTFVYFCDMIHNVPWFLWKYVERERV